MIMLLHFSIILSLTLIGVPCAKAADDNRTEVPPTVDGSLVPFQMIDGSSTGRSLKSQPSALMHYNETSISWAFLLGFIILTSSRVGMGLLEVAIRYVDAYLVQERYHPTYR
ncbi:MAG: hypothetical protein EBS61_13860 [Betaproteobacteria bacterium]|nr:hypothetical protein [Betaproteobacteria bacterium]